MSHVWLGSTCTSDKRFSTCIDSHNDNDESILTAEIMQHLSSMLSMETSKDEMQHSGGHSTLVDIHIGCSL